MNVRGMRLGLVTLAILLWVGPTAMGDSIRKMRVPFLCNNAGMIYMVVQNPSATQQRVTVDFKILYAKAVKPTVPKYWWTSGCGHTACQAITVAAAATKPQGATSGEVIMDPETGFQGSVQIDGSSGYDLSGQWGCAVDISVTSSGDQGYIVAHGITTTSGTPNPLLINAGKPF